MMVSFDKVNFEKMRGLVPVVVRSAVTGEILMQAFANEEALKKTMETGYAHFYSRTRNKLWKKGETSGNVLKVLKVWTDCDFDSIVYEVVPSGPTCHTGRWSCFHNWLQYDVRWDELWKLLVDAFSEAKVMVRKGVGVEGSYLYVVNPITDSIPPANPLMVSLMVDYLLDGLYFRDLDKVVTPEALGLPLGSVISYKTGLPQAIVRKRKYGVDGWEVKYTSGYEGGRYYVYGVEPGDKVLLVDDALSTGGTALSLLKKFSEKEVEVRAVLVGLNKPQYKGEEKVKEQGYGVRKVVDLWVDESGWLRIKFMGREVNMKVPVVYST